LNICQYSNDSHGCQQQVLAPSSSSSCPSTTQTDIVLPAVNGETYDTAFIDYSQLQQQQQQQQFVAFIQQVCSASQWIIIANSLVLTKTAFINNK